MSYGQELRQSLTVFGPLHPWASQWAYFYLNTLGSLFQAILKAYLSFQGKFAYDISSKNVLIFKLNDKVLLFFLISPFMSSWEKLLWGHVTNG